MLEEELFIGCETGCLHLIISNLFLKRPCGRIYAKFECCRKNMRSTQPQHNFIKFYALGLMIFSILFLGGMFVFFFYNLSTGSSDYTANGVMQTLQLFYNIMNGRPFQTSLFALDSGLGFHNPYAYLHNFAIHVNFVPMLLAPIWNIWPNISWLYGLFFLVNYLSIMIFTWVMLKYLSPHSYRIKAFLAFGLFFCSGFFFTFEQNAQFLLLSGPFICAASYFLVIRKLIPFVISLMLLCLVSEDAAMVAVTFSCYVLFFERGAKRFAYIGGILSFAYLFLVMFVIQPASRAELDLTSSTTAWVVIGHILSFKLDLPFILLGLAPFLFFLPAFGIIYLLFGKSNVSWVKLGGLVFLAPLPHWGECIIVGATHHLMPVIAFTFVAFVLALGCTPDNLLKSITLSKKQIVYIFCLTGLFFMGSVRLLASNLPDSVLPPIYRLVGKPERAARVEQRIADLQVNQRVIEVANQIPKERSLVFLTNISIGGFIADRPNIWQFSDLYSNADYLLLQPEAVIFDEYLLSRYTDDLFQKEWLAKGRLLTVHGARIPKEWLILLVQHLVTQEKLYRVVVDEPGVILLERINMKSFYAPSSTTGFGWIPNIGKKPVIMSFEATKGVTN